MEKKVFTGHTTICMLISAGIILAAIILSACGLGMNMGIDFTGGSLLKYEVKQEFDVKVVENALRDMGITDFQIAQTGEGDIKTEMQIRTKDLGDTADDLRVQLEEKLKESYPELSFISIDTVGGVAGRDLIANALKACLIVFVCLLIYIAFRFDFYSGLAALVALLHDVLIMCSFMVFFRSLYQVNSPFIAALLTIIGYSINNTIVIFDRIRENRKNTALKGQSHQAIVEVSVTNTLTRTINTTLTTLFTLVTLFILGVPSIREFTFPLLVGMLAGVYSSVMLSGQIWAFWLDRDSFGGIRRLFKHARPKKA